MNKNNKNLTNSHPFDVERPLCPLRKCNMKSHHSYKGSGWDFEYHTTYNSVDFVQCNKCKIIFQKEIPKKSELAKIYPKNYYSFNETKKSIYLVKIVRDWMAKKKGNYYREIVSDDSAKVLDIGCGDGRLLEILKSSCPAGWTYAGIDWSSEAIQSLLKKGFEGRSGDITEINLSDWESKFNLILSHQLIEHVHDPRLLLVIIYSLLKPGGTVSIETPDIDSWDFKLLHQRYWSVYHIPRHFYLFNKENFCEMARSIGFDIISVKSLVNPVSWIHSLKSYCEDHYYLRRFSKIFHHQNPFLLAFFTSIEIIQIYIFNKSSNMQINLKKCL